MKAFAVTIKLAGQVLHFAAIAHCSADVCAAAQDQFGACGVSAIPYPRRTV